MTGRLRLDKMVNLIEAFLRAATDGIEVSEAEGSSQATTGNTRSSTNNLVSVTDASGPLYFKAPETSRPRASHHTREQEIMSAIPLSEVLASTSQAFLSGIAFPKLRKLHSMPSDLSMRASPPVPAVLLQMRSEPDPGSGSPAQEHRWPDSSSRQQPRDTRSMRERRPLVNRPGLSDLDIVASDSLDGLNSLDYMTVPDADSTAGAHAESRVIPLIPFDELMLIETIGTGRVSTIYRAAWQRGHFANVAAASGPVQMVALKVAMVNTMTGDTSHVDELRREADIASRLEHPNICDLVGVAADPECFCLAYEYCEGGSLLSLLSDPTRYYEYLPIALDIAQGMAFLHKKCIIHRDLKPSNILLTRDHRAKISDFGMSINNHGQELTAETGTYRYMAPEVIRHESYSSNADVYSFGICLWQLITREVPFASMTPIQAAYAVAEGRRPEIPVTTPRRLQEIIRCCWDQDSHRRPSFTYVAMALADYAKMAFSPANVGTLTLQIANEMLATVEGNSTVNVDFTTPVAPPPPFPPSSNYFDPDYSRNDSSSNVGLEIE
jgi:serine/threonine protein kinase